MRTLASGFVSQSSSSANSNALLSLMQEQMAQYSPEEIMEMIIKLGKEDELETKEEYEEGKPIVEVGEDELDEQTIRVKFTLKHAVEVGDPAKIAYRDYLQTFYGDKRASEIIIKNEGAWAARFPVKKNVPCDITVQLSSGLYVEHLTGVKDENRKMIAELYLVKHATQQILTEQNAEAVNTTIKKLCTLPSLSELESEYTQVLNESKQVAKQMNDAQAKKEEQSFDKNIIRQDNTTVQPLVMPMHEPDRRSAIKRTIENNEQTKKLLAQNPELKELLMEALLLKTEGTILSGIEGSQNVEMLGSYLSLQKQNIQQSELYAELEVARQVYQNYWDLCWQLLDGNAEFKKIHQNSSIAEGNMAGDSSIIKESLDYNGPLVWQIIEKKLSHSGFANLRENYPDIYFGQSQFLTLWQNSGGQYTPTAFNLSAGQTKSKALSFVREDRTVINMLSGGQLFNLNTLAKQREKNEEPSLVEQLGDMVTQSELIDQTLGKVKTELSAANNGAGAIALKTVLIPGNAFDAPIDLKLYLAKSGKNQWEIIDFSMPLRETPRYKGSGKSDAEAIANALANLGQEAAYPKGDIIAQGPEKIFGKQQRLKAFSTGSNFDQEAAETLSLISTISGILGIALCWTPVGPAFLYLSAFTALGAGTLKLKDRAEHDTLEFNSETMLDLVDVISGSIVGAQALGRIVKITNQVSGSARLAVITQSVDMGTNVAGMVIIGNQYLERLQAIENNPKLNEAEKAQQRSDIYKEAAAAGLLMLFGYTAPKLKQRFNERSVNNRLKENKRFKNFKDIDEKDIFSKSFKEFGEEKYQKLIDAYLGDDIELFNNLYFQYLTELSISYKHNGIKIKGPSGSEYKVVAKNKMDGEIDGKYAGFEKIKYFDEVERAEFEVFVGSDEKLYFKDGQTVQQKLGSNEAIFVMDLNGKIYCASPKQGIIHHSSFLSGGDVAAAGEITIKFDRFEINLQSGHYEPSSKSNEQIETELINRGIKRKKIKTGYF